MFSNISLARFVGVHPEVIRRATQVESQLSAEGIGLLIIEGGRSWAQQSLDYSKGRDGQGNIVTPSQVITWALPGHSWHQYYVCFDGCPLVAGHPIWNTSDPSWVRLLAIAQSNGLISGRCFKSSTGKPEPDFDHFQPQEIPESPTDEIRQTFKDGGVPAVWEELKLTCPS